MLPTTLMRVIFLGSCFSFIQCHPHPTDPAIAMVCGKVTQHLDIDTGEWVTDPSRTKDCMSDLTEILHYCRQVYPTLNVTNVMKQSRGVKIQPWCSMGHTGSTCKGRGHTVFPVRCVVRSSGAPPLVVSPGCVIDSLYDASLCKGHSYWKAKASKACQKTGMIISDQQSTTDPCENALKWHGIHFGCCPNTKKRPEKETKKIVLSNLDPVCLQPKKIGMCRAALDAWYFNSDIMRCDHFIYGGCGGSDNRFQSFDDCQERCKVVLPPVDELLKIPPKGVLLGVGPVILDTSSDEVTTLASPVSQSQESVDDTPYLDSAMNPEREHEMYMKSRMQQLEDHQHKMAQATRQWDDSKMNLLKSKSSEDKLAEADKEFHKKVTALTNEHKQKQSQLLDAHLARIDAYVVESRTAALQNFKDQLNSKQLDPSDVLRAFKRYIKSEHKDQMHTTQHLNLALEGSNEVNIQDRLAAIQVRVSNAMELARGNPGMESDILDEMNELAQRKVPLVTFTLPSDDVANEPVRIDNGGLPAENTEHREEISLDEIDELIEDEETDDYDDDETYVSSDIPEPLHFPNHDFSIDDIIKDFNENREVNPARVYGADDVILTAGESSYSESRWMRWVIGFGGGLGVILILIALAKFWQIHHARRQHFTKLEVEDHLTPEERQLLQMQQNGYENPTYKFFEKQQVA